MRVKRTPHERKVRKAYLEAEQLMAAGKPNEAWTRLYAVPPAPKKRQPKAAPVPKSYHLPSKR